VLPVVICDDHDRVHSGAARPRVDKVSSHLSSVQQMVGHFVQVAPDGSRTQGEFYVQKPGRVRFEYDPPTA
jgi:outer membrane lipoprotein-sorting protein